MSSRGDRGGRARVVQCSMCFLVRHVGAPTAETMRRHKWSNDNIISAVREVHEARQIATGSPVRVHWTLVVASTFTEEMGPRSFRSREENGAGDRWATSDTPNEPREQKARLLA